MRAPEHCDRGWMGYSWERGRPGENGAVQGKCYGLSASM